MLDLLHGWQAGRATASKRHCRVCRILSTPEPPCVCASHPHTRLLCTHTQVHGLTPWPLQSGPEFIHGKTNVLVDVMEQAGYKFEERRWPDYWYFPSQEKKLVHDDDVDDEVDKVCMLATRLF
eukprot:351491-Chlamydomonas_euryale.AAC.44